MGKPALKVTGTLRYEYLVDAAGTPANPGVLDIRVLKEQTGHVFVIKTPVTPLHQYIG